MTTQQQDSDTTEQVTPSTYSDRLAALADFLRVHDSFDSNAVSVSSDGPNFHLARFPNWREVLDEVLDDLGPATHEQTHDDVFVLRVHNTDLGTVTLYIPRWISRPRVDRGPEVSLDEIVTR